MYRVWYSTESFADYIIDHTVLSHLEVVKNKMYESDANNPQNFHKMPDHIRKILYLDAPDIIVERNSEPLFSIEISSEAGTGHNAFQRFARIAASVENQVPALYIYPEGAIITRQGSEPVWDRINPLIFKALEDVMNIYNIPAMLYYYPSDIQQYKDNPAKSPNFLNKGLRNDPNIFDYPGCPDANSTYMQDMFSAINLIIESADKKGTYEGRLSLIGNPVFREQRSFMNSEYIAKSEGRTPDTMSPLSAVSIIPTEILMNYLRDYESGTYKIGNLLRSRPKTALYQVNAKFRGDPYPGALAAIDYLKCRCGKTFEDREINLVLVFGKVNLDLRCDYMEVLNEKGSTIEDFFSNVQNASRHNMLTKNYQELRNDEISRYFMQVRYGSTYSKIKHIRVFSYFADAILFPDGALWRDA